MSTARYIIRERSGPLVRFGGTLRAVGIAAVHDREGRGAFWSLAVGLGNLGQAVSAAPERLVIPFGAGPVRRFAVFLAWVVWSIEARRAYPNLARPVAP